MQRLVRGFHAFHEQVFKPMREFFEQLTAGQRPRALFVGCSDSRVSADLITHAEPGDLFVLRNAGNLIPPHGADGGGEAATVEYAVSVLGIPHIIVCGHSNCGAMKSLFDRPALAELPTVARWLEHAEATRQIMKDQAGQLPPAEFQEAAAKANVLVQLENLRTHPAVAAALRRGTLFLHGWYYRFESGEVFAYHPVRSRFESVLEVPPVAAAPQPLPVSELPDRPGTPAGARIAEESAV